MTATNPDSRWIVTRRTWLVAILAGSMLVVIAMVVSTLHGILRIETAAAEHRAEVDGLDRLAEGTRLAQVEFKTQVQEWKNILLRGHNPVQFERFLGAFMARNAEIQAQLEELMRLARAVSFPDDELVDLRIRHQDVLTAYQDALKRFRADDPMSPRSVDALLQGLDRTLNTQFNRFAGTVAGFEDASSAAFMDRLDSISAAMRAAILAEAGILIIVLLLGIFVVRQTEGHVP
jgi:hypothetical protein